MDSDCVFNQPVTPDHYFKAGKPILPFANYNTLPADVPWKRVTEEVISAIVENEYMRRPGLVYPVELFAEFRRRISLIHEMPFEDFILSRKADFPWGFSEFNAIGAFAHLTPRWINEFHWVDLGKDGKHDSCINQYWSHAGINDEHNFPSGGRGKPIDDFRRLGLC
jgi:hypothetical protein